MKALSCPRCNKRLMIDESLWGRWVSCQECGMQFAATSEDETEDTYYPVSSPGTSIAYFVCGILFFAACLSLLVVFLKRTENQPQVGREPAPRPAARVHVESIDAYRQRIQEKAFAAPATASEDASWILKHAVWISLAIAYVVGVILMLAWVARDSRARGVDGGAVWVLLVLLTGYLISASGATATAARQSHLLR